MSDLKRREVIETSEIILNVSGTLDYPEKYNAGSALVYIDTDPVFTQIAAKLGASSLERRGIRGRVQFNEAEIADPETLRDWSREEKIRRRLDLHDVHFTVGETLSEALRDTGHNWRPTKHPIALAEWRDHGAPGTSYTTGRKLDEL